MSERKNKRSGKVLSAEDRALWRRVTENVTPAKRSLSAEELEMQALRASLAGSSDAGSHVSPDQMTGGAGTTASKSPPEDLVSGASQRPDHRQQKTIATGLRRQHKASTASSEAIAVSQRTPPRAAGAIAPGGQSSSRLDPKLVRKISKGREGIDARLDLHGYRQSEAQAELRRFLFRCHRSGKRTLLVITGKGLKVESDHQSEDWTTDARDVGVLRRQLPIWLSAPDLRVIVAGFDEAHARHGGTGAFYVRLRNASRN